MTEKEKEQELQEKISYKTKQMFKELETLDKSKKPSKETLDYIKNIAQLVEDEINSENSIKVRNTFQEVIKTRKDLGEIKVKSTIIKKIEIINNYNGYSKPLRSIAYYQLMPVMNATKPIVQILEWTVSHHPCWVIWFTSPIIKGLQTRTEGEYLVIHSLTEKESEDHNLLLKFKKYPCFGRSDGFDVLLGYADLEEAVEFVERFISVILERNLYGDPEFLKFLQNYRKTKLKFDS